MISYDMSRNSDEYRKIYEEVFNEEQRDVMRSLFDEGVNSSGVFVRYRLVEYAIAELFRLEGLKHGKV